MNIDKFIKLSSNFYDRDDPLNVLTFYSSVFKTTLNFRKSMVAEHFRLRILFQESKLQELHIKILVE